MEDWRPVEGYAGYEISDLGRVKGRWGRILKPFFNSNWYYRVTLCAGDVKHVSHGVSALVLAAFVGPRPLGYQAAHLNGIKTDNRLENLVYILAKDNEAHKVAHGTALLGERNHQAKLSTDKVKEIRALSRRGISQDRIAVRYRISQAQVYRIVHRKGWTHVT